MPMVSGWGVEGRGGAGFVAGAVIRVVMLPATPVHCR